jgi:hypothetical protein
MKRLIKKADNISFYHGTNIKNALNIIKNGEINTRNSQTEKQETYNNTFNNNAIYLTTNFNKSKSYAGKNYGVIFTIAIDDNDKNILLDEDIFDWDDDGDDVNSDNIVTLQRMFNSYGEYQATIEKWRNQGYFKKIPDDLGGYYNESDIVHKDDCGDYFFNIASIMYAAPDIAAKMCEDIPKKSIISKETIAYGGNISLSNVTQYSLITPNEERLDFNNSDDLINKYNEINQGD